MKISISARLFLAVLATAAFAVLAMGLAAHWSFTRGFVGYLNELAIRRLDAAVPRLGQTYAQAGSWAFLRDNRSEWFSLMRQSLPEPVTELEGSAESTDDLPPRPPASDLTGAVLRFSLLDAQSRWVIGYPEQHADTIRREIRASGRVVGYLTLAPFESVSGAGDKRFERNQLRASWTVGLVCLLSAAVIALWVARRLLKPVRRVADATHRIAAGEYRSRVEVESDDEVGQLARDFNTMADTLERNESMRREFIADVSHELRTPLGVLHGELEAIEDGVHKLGPETVKTLQAEVATLNKLVSDLYDLSLADVGALAYRREPLDLMQVLSITVDAFGTRLAERGLEASIEPQAAPLAVDGDERRLQQLFNNLLENGVRYTDPGGRLRIGARPEGDEIVVDLMDSSPGVAPERLPRLFDRFYRGDSSRNRASGGAGLGLAICRSIVAAHDGRIEARPSPLGGLWIEVRLPAIDARARSVVPGQRGEDAGRAPAAGRLARRDDEGPSALGVAR